MLYTASDFSLTSGDSSNTFWNSEYAVSYDCLA